MHAQNDCVNMRHSVLHAFRPAIQFLARGKSRAAAFKWHRNDAGRGGYERRDAEGDLR